MSGEETLPPSASRRGSRLMICGGRRHLHFWRIPRGVDKGLSAARRSRLRRGRQRRLSAGLSLRRAFSRTAACNRYGVTRIGACDHAGRRSATLLPEAAIAAGRRLGEARRLDALDRKNVAGCAGRYGSSAGAHRSPFSLTWTLPDCESWVRIGIRSGDDGPARRIRFFRLEDPEAERWLQRASGVVGFLDLEARLKPYLTALWGIRLPLREVPAGAPEAVKTATGFRRRRDPNAGCLPGLLLQ